MSLVGRRVSRWTNDEGVVREVVFDAHGQRWRALVRRDDGKLESWDLEQCAEVEPKPCDYVRPPPTSVPGGGVPL